MSICLGHRIRHSTLFRHSLASSHLNTGQNCEPASFEPRAEQLCVCIPAVCAHLCVLNSCLSVYQLCVHLWKLMCACLHVSTHGSQRKTSQVDSHCKASKDRIFLVCFSDQLLQASRLTSLQSVLLSTSLCFGWDYRCILLHLAVYVGSGDGTQASRLCGQCFY